jgi:hypothetical protein
MFLGWLGRKALKPTLLGRWSLQNNWQRSLDLAGSDSCLHGLTVYMNGNEEKQGKKTKCQSSLQRRKGPPNGRAKQKNQVAGKSLADAGTVTTQ